MRKAASQTLKEYFQVFLCLNGQIHTKNDMNGQHAHLCDYTSKHSKLCLK